MYTTKVIQTSNDEKENQTNDYDVEKKKRYYDQG
jgi:hypothetical protein